VKRTTKNMFIQVAVAGGLLLLGRSVMAQQDVPIHDPTVTPATGLTSTAAWEPIAPGQLQPMRADAIGPQGPIAGETEIPWGESGETDSLAGDPAAGFPAPAVCEICGEGEDAPPPWYVQQDVRVLSIADPYNILTSTLGRREQVEVVDRTDPQNPFVKYEMVDVFDPIMGTRSMMFDVAAGYSTTVGRHLGRDTENRDHFLEFTYWGMQRWDGSAQTNATDVVTTDAPLNFVSGNLYSPFPEGVRGFNRADQHWIAQESRLNDYELNVRLRPRGRADRMVLYPNGRWRRQCQPGTKLSYLFGMRVLTLDESFGFHSRGTLDVIDPDTKEVLERRPIAGDYLINSHSNLVGLQIGFDYVIQKCKWNWGFHGKTGPYINFADQVSRIVTDAAGDETSGSFDLDERRVADADNVAALLEFGVESSYKIRPNVSLRASYDLMWMIGMARAAEQLDFDLNSVPKLRSEAVMFTHGLSLGVECLW